MIKKAGTEDAGVLAGLAIKMWTEHDPAELESEFRQLCRNDEAACFIKYAGGEPAAFAQCQLRHDYVEGTDSSPVGFWRAYLSRKGTAGKDLRRNCWRNAKNGLWKRAAANSQAIAGSTMRTA